MFRQFLLGVSLLLSCEGLKLASYIKPCKRDDPNLNKCAEEHGAAALPFIFKGDKEYNIPNMLPLKLPKVQIDASDSLKITLNNVELFGLDNMQINYIKIDLDKKEFDVSVKSHYINIQGTYEMDGRILILPIRGSGPANLTFTDGVFNYHFTYEIITKNGEEYMANIKPTITHTIKKAYYQFDNLFNGDKTLGDQTNKFLNENEQEVTKELSPAVSETINAIVTSIINSMLPKIPFHEIFV